MLTVEPRVLRRIIRRHRRLSGLGLEVVHGHVYTLPRAELLALLRPGELGGAPVPEQPILVPAGTPPERLPRLRFHARIHQAIAARRPSAALLRERIHRIGQTEFDEIRFVLRQDDLLLPPRDDLETYTEFAARFLELRHFEPAELARSFPTLRDLDGVERILALDVDVAPLLEGAPSEPPSAPTAVARTAAPVLALRPELAPAATAARARGNLARAAVASLAAGQADQARADLEKLAAEIDLPDPPRAAAALEATARAAAVDGIRRTPPLRLLYDLQKAAIDRVREPLSVNVARWLMSLGRAPLVRPLIAGRDVRLARRLGHAAAKVHHDEALGAILHEGAERAADRARAALRPELERALDEVGLRPANLPEEVAREKLVAELLDGVLAHGRIGLGDLRDSLAKNQLKLPNLRGPVELVRGDPLLRADRLLADRLAGVYARGEIYLRFLQKLSSLFFGTAVGQFLTRFAILPVLGAYLLLEGLAHVVGPLVHHGFGVRLHIFSWERCAVLSVYFFGLIHSHAVRRATVVTARAVGKAVHATFVAAPRAVWRSAPVQAFVRSTAVGLGLSYLIKPAVLAVAVFFVADRFGIDDREAIFIAAAGFVVGAYLVNSPFGSRLEEMVADLLVRAGRHLGRRILPGLVRLILDVFKALLELIDRGIYAVDELVRFRRGDSRLVLVAKGLVGSTWGIVAYLFRIYVNLLVEPTVNPVKHFPIVTVAGKIMVPISPTLIGTVRTSLAPLVGMVAGTAIAGALVGFFPGFFGFLAWELKANWSLYRANRPRDLRPVAIGHHGEPMGRLLRPGLHSGTIPKTYARLRRAVWRGKDATRQKGVLRHVEEAVEHFVERELCALLDRAPGWQARVSVAAVEIGSNRVRVELARDGARAAIAFEEQSGWLVGGLAEPGWVAALDAREAALFAAALAGLYKRAGVDLVREQIAAVVTGPYDIAPEGLVVWEDDWTTETVFPLDPERDGRMFFSRQPLTWNDWVGFWSGGLTLPSETFTLLTR